MIEYLYRFRSIEALLGKYAELEKQEIYFASPELLNDPVEGFKDMYWSGGEIIWKNLLKHYLLCLEQVCVMAIIGGEDHPIDSALHIPVFKTVKDFPTKESLAIYQEICTRFFVREEIKKYPELLASRTSRIRQNELVFYLRLLHYHALDTILSIYEKHNLLPIRADDDPIRNLAAQDINIAEMVEAINNQELSRPDIEDLAEKLYAAAKSAQSQIDLILQYNSNNSRNNEMLVFSSFPEEYVKQLSRLVHGNWYTACFLTDYSNPSMWGYYGDNHKGACLKFRTPTWQDKPSIDLYGITGISGNQDRVTPIYGNQKQQFHKINYEDKYPEIDFFRSISKMSLSALNESWYCDEQGAISSCAIEIHNPEEEWRKKYWATFYRTITTKLRQWGHEQEFRLILTPTVMDYSPVEHRKFKYQLNDLEGIIFGINTSAQDRHSIMKIIEEKCRTEGRGDFKFYQAYYARHSARIEIQEMGLVKFNAPTIT